MKLENELQLINSLPIDLFEAQKLAYEPSGLICKNIIREVESKEYYAYTFEMNNKHIKLKIKNNF